MSTLLLRLAGPLQAWGDASRFSRRLTAPQPTKSGVLGLLAAALGRRRTDPLEDLLGLSFGVRLDQPGRLERDFQVARTMDGHKAMPLSYRYYLSDAVFLAAVQGDGDRVAMLDDAVRRPAFPLYLGRRSCPPAGRVTLGLRDLPLRAALEQEPWQASLRVRRQERPTVELEVLADAEPGDPASIMVQDVPVSFDPQWRRYSLRSVHRFTVTVANPEGRSLRAPTIGVDGHEPMSALGGA